MTSLKHKIFPYLAKAKQALGFFLFSKTSGRLSQMDIDKKLVYSLSPRKIPSGRQLKYLPRFLNARENKIIKICAVIILINLVYLGFFLSGKYLKSVPVAGGLYTEAVIGYPKAINPLYASSRDVDNDLSRLVYSSLYRYDAAGKLSADLATDYILSEDKKEYIITIKSGVKWHNGNELTADDVVFTFNLIQNESYRSPLRAELVGVNIEKIDERTVKFILPEPYAPFLEMLSFGIMPKVVWEKINPDAAALADVNLKPIGSGPYKFKSLSKNKNGDLREYHLEVNQDYYGQIPYIEEINFKFYTDHAEAIAAFNSGQIDGLSVLPFEYRSDLAVKDSTRIYDLLKPQIFGIFFNQANNKTLEDKNVRAALAQAIDKNGLVAEIFAEAYQVADSPILKTNAAYGGNISRYDFNLEAAKSALADKNLTIKFTVIDVNSNVAVAEKIKTYWEAAGVIVELNIVPLEQAANMVRNREFEALLYGQLVGGDPDVFAFWHSSQIGVKGLNLAAYNNTEVDQLLTEARTIASSEERISKYQRFQEILTADIPTIFLYSPAYTYIHNRRVKGFEGQTIFEPADRFSLVSAWYIKTKKILAK